MSYSSRSSFRASSSSYKYSSDGGADGYSASSYKTSSRIGGLGSPSRLSETSASRISRLDDDGGITSTTSSSRRLLGRGDDAYESSISSSRLSGSQLYSRKDSDDDFISRRLSSTSSTSGHRAITSGAGEDGMMSSYASRRISRGLSGDLDLGGSDSTSYTASRRSVRASGLSSIDDDMTGESMLSKRSRDYSEESSSSSRKYTRTYGIEEESEPISISRTSRLSSRFSEEDSSMVSGSTARRQYSRLSSTGDDDIGTSSATRQYSRLSSLKDDDIPMLTGSSTRRQYSSRLSSMDEGDQSIGSASKRLSRLSSTNDDEQTFSGSSSRRQYSRLSSTDGNEPMLTGSSVRRQYSRLTDDDQVLSSSSSSRRQFSRIGSAADDEPISSASTRQYSRLSSINDDDQILSGSSSRRKYSSRVGSVYDEDDQVLSSSSSARRQYSRLSSADDDQTYSASSTRRQASRIGSTTNDDDLYSATGRRPLSRLSSHANDDNIEASSKSYKRLDSQESSLSTIRRKSSLVSDEDSILSGSGLKRSLDKGDSIRSYRITSVDRDDDYSVPRSPKIRAKNSELDDVESDLLSYSKQRRDSTGETHSLRDTSDASQPRESWKEQVEKAKQLSRELEELASQDLGLPQPKKVKESGKEPRTPARIKMMRQETAEGIESIPVSPQVQEPPTSGEITPQDHPLQSSQISELTSEAVTRAGGLDDFRAYEEQDTVVTESLRSGSVTSIEEFASSEDDSLYSSANEVAGKPPFVRTASSKPVSRNDHSEHVDLLRPDSRPCTPGGSIVPHAPVFKAKLKDVQLLEASNVRFEMIARAMPLPTVTFYKDDKLLEQNDRVRVVFENKECFELIIDHVKPEDEGIYKAVAINPLGEDMTVGRLTTTKHKDVFPGLDDDFSFAECESTEISRADSRLGSAASASPAFRWFKDGHEFEASDRFQCSFDDQEDSIALLFQHVTPGDAGLYTCVANTCSGKISCSAELNVQGEVRKIREPEAPRIKASMNDVEVNEGASAMLEAKITGFPRPRIVWYKDNEKVVSDERHKFMYEDEESYTLVIKNVRITDAARYRIVATSDLGEVETSGNLTVTTTPKIKRQLRDQCVMTDGPLRLDVGVEGNPPPEAQWFKDGKELKENDRIKIMAEDDVRSLIIESAKLEDSGNYSCVVTNSCGQQTTQTVVKVNASPKFETKLKDTSVAAGDTVEFKAKITGEPKPEVEFLKDGEKITPDSRIKIEKEGDTHRLIIRKAKEEDAGSYQCVAKNEHGSVESDGKLEVLMGPIFEESLHDRECNEDDKDIDMSVKINAKPEAEVKWLYENKEIRMSETKNIIKESDGRYTLRMKSVTQEETGKYTVVASNSEGEARSSAVLTVTKSKEKLKKEEMLKRQMSEERKRKEEEERRKEKESKKDEVMEQDEEKKSLSRRASQMEHVKEEDEAEMEKFKASSRRESREKLSRQASKIDEAEIGEKKEETRRVSKDSGRDEDMKKKIDGDTNTDDMRRDDKDTSPKIDGDVSMDRRQSRDSRDKRLLGDGDVDDGDESDDQGQKFKRKASGDSNTDSKLSKSGSSRDKVVGDGNIDGSSSDTKSKPKLRGDSSFDQHPKMPSQDSEMMDESDEIFGDRPKSASERRPSKTVHQERRASSSRPRLEDSYPSDRKPSIHDVKQPSDDGLRRKSIEPRLEDDILDEHGLLLGRRRSSAIKPVDKGQPVQKSTDDGKTRKPSIGTEPETRFGKPGSHDGLSSDQIEQSAEDKNKLPMRRGSSTKPIDEAENDQKLNDLLKKSPSGSKFSERKPSLSDATMGDRRALSRSDSVDGIESGQLKPEDDDCNLEEQSKPFSKTSRKPSISKVPEVESQTDVERRPSLKRTPSDNLSDDRGRRKSSSSQPDYIATDRRPSIGVSETDSKRRPSLRGSPDDSIPDEMGRRKSSSSHPYDTVSDRKPSIGASEPDSKRRPSLREKPSDNVPDEEVSRKSSPSHPYHGISDRKPSVGASDTDTERRPSFKRGPSDDVSDERGRRKSSSLHRDHATDRKPSIGTSETDSEHKLSLGESPSDEVPGAGVRRKSSSSHPDHGISDRKPSIGASDTDTERRPSFKRAPSYDILDERERRKSSSSHPDRVTADQKPSFGISETDAKRKPSLQESPDDSAPNEMGRRKSSSTQPDRDNYGRKPSIGTSETERRASFKRSPSDDAVDERGRRKGSSSHPNDNIGYRKPSIGASETDYEGKPSLQRSPSENVPDEGVRRKSSSSQPDHGISDRKPSIEAPDTERRPSFRKAPSDDKLDDKGRRKSSSSHPNDTTADRKPSIGLSGTDEKPKVRKSPADHRRLSSIDEPDKQVPQNEIQRSTSSDKGQVAPIDQRDIYGKQPQELDEGKTSRKPSLLGQDSLKSPSSSRRGSELGQSDSHPMSTEYEALKPNDKSSPELRKSPSTENDKSPIDDITKNDKQRRRSSFKPILEDVTDSHESRKPELMRGQSSTLDNRGGDALGPTISHPDDDERDARLFGPRRSKDRGPQIEEIEDDQLNEQPDMDGPRGKVTEPEELDSFPSRTIPDSSRDEKHPQERKDSLVKKHEPRKDSLKVEDSLIPRDRSESSLEPESKTDRRSSLRKSPSTDIPSDVPRRKSRSPIDSLRHVKPASIPPDSKNDLLKSDSSEDRASPKNRVPVGRDLESSDDKPQSREDLSSKRPSEVSVSDQKTPEESKPGLANRKPSLYDEKSQEIPNEDDSIGRRRSSASSYGPGDSNRDSPKLNDKSSRKLSFAPEPEVLDERTKRKSSLLDGPSSDQNQRTPEKGDSVDSRRGSQSKVRPGDEDSNLYDGKPSEKRSSIPKDRLLDSRSPSASDLVGEEIPKDNLAGRRKRTEPKSGDDTNLKPRPSLSDSQDSRKPSESDENHLPERRRPSSGDGFNGKVPDERKKSVDESDKKPSISDKKSDGISATTRKPSLTPISEVDHPEDKRRSSLKNGPDSKRRGSALEPTLEAPTKTDFKASPTDSDHPQLLRKSSKPLIEDSQPIRRGSSPLATDDGKMRRERRRDSDSKPEKSPYLEQPEEQSPLSSKTDEKPSTNRRRSQIGDKDEKQPSVDSSDKKGVSSTRSNDDDDSPIGRRSTKPGASDTPVSDRGIANKYPVDGRKDDINEKPSKFDDDILSDQQTDRTSESHDDDTEEIPVTPKDRAARPRGDSIFDAEERAKITGVEPIDDDSKGRKLIADSDMGDKPVFEKGLVDREAMETDNNVEFDIKLKDTKPKPKIDWFVDDVLIMPNDRRYKMVPDEASCVYKLIIRRPDETMEGVYKCKASNEYGYDETSAKFTIIREPKFIKKLRDKDIDISDKLILSVKVDGIPEPEVTWYKDGEEVAASATITLQRESDGSHSLIIEKSQNKDEGTYKCVAINKLGKDETVAKITVLSPPEFSKKLEDVTVTLGDSIVLEVKVSGADRVMWYKDGLKYCDAIAESDGITYRLKLASAKMDDAGEYRCVAWNSFGRVDSGIGKLTVKPLEDREPPKFTKPLQDIEVAGDTDARFDVQVTGSPKPKVSWLRDGIDLKESDRIIMKEEEDNSYSLTIKNTKQSDEAVYSCSASNEMGEAQDQASLTVKMAEKQEKPRITGLRDIETEIGSDVDFSAKVSGYPVPEVVWKKDGKTLRSDDNIRISRDTEDETLHHLRVKKVQESDTGSFTLRASNPAGEEEKSAQLTITIEAPHFTKQLRNITAKPDTEIILEAEVAGYPSPKITWFKDGKELKESSSVIITQEDGVCRLILKNISNDSAGLYTCKAENEAGTDETEATLTVSVGQESPRFTKPLHDETVDQGDEIVLEVEVKGSPPPLISWFKDGRRLSQSPKVSITQADGISKLVLKNANDDNAGLYTCKADNDTGQDETQANVNVNPPQEAPKFIRPLRDIAGQPGKNIVLETEVTGFPSPKISWYQDGRRLSESANVSISESDGICKLVLRNISDSSVGTVSCKAENPIGKDETTSKVSVQSPLKFIKSLPPKMDVPEGDSFRLEAQLSGPLDQAEIKWLKDGKEIPEDRRHRIAVDQDGNIALIVEDSSPNDVGNYQVVVQTPTQKIHSDCHVSLIPKEIKKVPRDPKFLEELRPAKVEEGTPLKLEAKVSGFPKPNVSWYKDDEPLSPGPHHGFIYEPDGTVGLLLDNCTSDDAGVYKAVATNDSGDATTEAQVDVEKPKPPSSKPTFSCDMKPIDVKQGESIFLQVKVDGNPPPSIKWLKDGDEIKPDGSHISIVTEPDGTTTLRIDHSMPEDSGKYTISAANDAGRNRTSVPVFVRRETKPIKKPEFEMPLVAITLKADEPGEISVKIVGEPKPEVRWFKNGEELVPNGRIHFEEKPSGTHSIVIDNVLPGDAGNYTCVIGNPAGEERSSAPVLVNQPPDFSKKLERSLSAIEGFPVKIETKVEGEPKPEITWSKDGETIIPDGDRIRIINEPDGLSSVVIQNARPSDKGTYGCTATNPLGTKKTEGDIDVKPKSKDGDEETEPRFIQSISDNDVDEGKSMRFEGVIEGNPISDIKWFRNGEELTYGSNIIPSFDGRRACLEIRNSGPRDEGEYECRVSNKLETVSSKAHGYVRPRCPPKFTQPLSDVSWSSRNPVTLSCRISGNPEPEIQWYYNGKLIQPSLKYRMKKDGDILSLTVLDPRPTDSGSFECRAKNSFGMDSTKCNLRISDRVSKDEPAHFIKRFNDYECEEGRTAKFTACISGNPKPELKWFKDGREFKPSSKHTIDVESNGIVRMTIKNVEPIDIGEYRLEISNSVGRDSSIARLSLEEPRFKRREPLDTSSTKGPPGIPSGVLEKPKILRMWDTGVSLGWKPSVSHVPTQPVTYAVDWTRYPSEDWKTYRSGIRGTRCDIPGLKPGQDYSFRVSAMNKYGASKPSPTLTAYRSKLYEPGDFKPKEYEIERPPTDKQACAPYWLRKEEDVMYGILRQPVTIEFWVYGYPEPNILWYFNDVEIKVGGGSKFDTLHDRNGKVCLFINRMTEQDVGVYTCKAWNEHGETVKKIRLLEAEPPMFTLRLKETTGMAYKSVRMECKVTGKPMPQVKWFKGWSPLYDSDRVKILWEDPDHSTMFMTSAITRDSGLYSVTAINFVGSASCSANLSIENDEILYNWANYVPRIVKPKRRAIEEHYDIGDEIGRGTQGVIYHAQERRSGDSYATKFMHGKGPMREFMQHELDAMNQLFHPKLLRLADAFDHKDTMCLVTDLCDGGDLLKSILERGTLTEGEVAHYIKQVLEGLNHMHCRDIGHLGLTIGDILVEHVNSDDIKIGDFGLTRKLAPGKPLFLRYGHPEFVAPEIVNNKESTLAADMWSVGIITYLLLTGISPFLGENDRETLTRLKEGQINFSHDAFAGVSGNARDFLTKLLVTEPTKRIDVKRALNHPWLQPGSISSLTEQLPCINNLKDYREKWKTWHKNASCKKWYRRNPMETCFTDPSKMIYPPDQEYSPPDTPTGEHHPKFKASEFDPSVSARPGWETMNITSESQYQSGPDTYLLPHRDVDFPLRIREYLRVGASRSPSLANNLRMSHWGDPNPYIGRRSSPQVSVRERRRFVEVMDEEIDDERKGLDNRRVPMRLQHEIGTPGHAYGQVHHLKQEAALNIGEKITVKAVPPYFREKIRDVIIDESDEVIFTCYPVGEPKPTITWFRNDGIILESPRAQYKDLPSGRVQLHIQPSYAIDAGCYKCVARNDHGVAFCRARLKFGTKPERPDTPKVKDVSSHEICLCWPPPKNSGNSWITSYSLEYQKRDESTWKTVSDDITQEIYLVDSLDPETTYVFRLKAKNKFGWSEVSLETDPITTKSAQVHSRVTLPRTLSIVRASERKKPPEDIEQQSDIDYTLEREPIAMKNDDLHQMFTIGDEISRGRFSLILSASMKDTNERVALKVCLSDNQSSSGIMNEHDIMKSLCHEKIARLVAACNGSNLIALAMEPLSGIDVVTFLSRKYQYNEDTVTKIITQILDGIEYLNFRNICVLELQPDNVVLVDDRLPHIKLVDFANARHVPVTGTRVSIQGQTEYLAPEILKKDEVFAATDIWCVGVLTYILLSGVSPFKGETEEETVENVTYVRYHFDHLYKEVTQEAIRFLMLVFKRSPSKRPTIDECLDHKWLIPNDYAVRKREKTLFSSSKLSQFTEANRSLKHSSTPGKLLTMFGIS